MQYRILVAEDDKGLNQGIRLALRKEELVFDAAYTLKEARKLWRENRPDMVLLDVNFPDGSGFDFLRELRRSSDIPVLVITANDMETDEVTGLTLGADDYITKPFRPLELVARVKAQLRRATKYNMNPVDEREDENCLVVSGIRMNRNTHECWLNERPLSLTPTEFEILWVLCTEKGQVVSSDELFRRVWGEKYFSSNNNTIMVHIRHLREKMKDSTEHPRYIRTVWGVGYKING